MKCILPLHETKKLIPMRMVAKGAEAEIFDIGKGSLLKRRVRKRYRMEALDARLRKARTRKEAKVLFAAKLAGVRCPLLLDADMENAELRLEKIRGGRLREVLEGGGMGKMKRLLHSAGEALAKLHDAGIVHGDFSSANILAEDGAGIAIIDFGLSDFSSSEEDRATDLLVFKKSVKGGEFQQFLLGYKKNCAFAEKSIRQLAEIEKRGRYVARAQAN